MEISNEKITEYSQRITLARMRLLCNNGFYGLLIMHIKMSLGDEFETAWTDGERLWFNPEFLGKISDDELDYTLMHVVMHIVLKHLQRGEGFDKERFDKACDIVANSNILRSCNMKTQHISLRCCGGIQPHSFNGKEGYEYTAEELYQLIPVSTGAKKGSSSKDGKHGKSSGNGEGGDEYNGNDKSNSEENDGGKSEGGSKGNSKGNGKGKGKGEGGWDKNSKLSEAEDDDLQRDIWTQRFRNACEVMSVRDPSNLRGTIPAFAERLLEELQKPQTDWRTILNEFIQDEIVDYSFTPPDRRFDDSPFFLPDFNEKDDKPENILFMIDTSGSMSDTMITAAYSEVKGAIDQYNGKLKGWLGFFDAAIIEPKPFENEEEFRVIRPQGGGGTDFHIIFEYVAKNMQTEPPDSIIILTDGYAPFPPQSVAQGIPVLWLLNNEKVEPAWGKVARITV